MLQYDDFDATHIVPLSSQSSIESTDVRNCPAVIITHEDFCLPIDNSCRNNEQEERCKATRHFEVDPDSVEVHQRMSILLYPVPGANY